jgi:hypothetical protein
MVIRRRGMHTGYWWKNQKRPLARQRHRWVNNIKMDLGERGQDRTGSI